MKLKNFNSYFILTILYIKLSSADTTDETLISGAKGEAVVDATIYKIQSLNIFPSDKVFIKRIALIVSEFGEFEQNLPNQNETEIENKLDEKPLTGGIWRVTELELNTTQIAEEKSNIYIALIKEKIHSKFGVNWTETKYKDLEIPLYSGLAFRIFLQTLQERIPDDLKSQRQIWEGYIKNSKRNDDNYEDFESVKVLKSENIPVIIRNAMNIVLILNLKEEDVKNNYKPFAPFATSYTAFLPVLENDKISKIGIIEYPVNSSESSIQKNPEILANLANIDPEDAKLYIVAEEGSNAMQKSKDLAIYNIPLSKCNDESSFKKQIIEIARDNDVIRKLRRTLLDLPAFIKEKFTLSPQQIEVNSTLEDELEENEVRYYRIPIPEGGLKLILKNQNGSSSAFYSFETRKPNLALNNGIIENTVFIPSKLGMSEIYVSVKGINEFNQYSIKPTRPAYGEKKTPGFDLVLIVVGGVLCMALVIALASFFFYKRRTKTFNLKM